MKAPDYNHFRSLFVQCPVDVNVYDASNQLLLTVKDGEVTGGSKNNIWYRSFNLGGGNDFAKVILYPVNSGYHVELVGTDMGRVDCLVQVPDGEGGFQTRSFGNIPVEKNSRIVTTTQEDAGGQYTVYQPGDSTGVTKEIQSVDISTETLQGISLESEKVSLKEGERELLKAIYEPVYANAWTLMWSSSDEKVAKVNQDGVVTALSEGTAVITATVLASMGEGKEPVTAVCTVTVGGADPIKAFVTRLYSGCFERTPDAAGHEYWTSNLRTGSFTGAYAAKFFFTSNEMKLLRLSDEQFITRLYTVMMDRKPDEGGLKYWKGFAENGMSRTWLVMKFINSAEFARICESYGITRGNVNTTENRDKNYAVTSFLARIYTKALSRGFDETGMNYWAGVILAAKNKKATMVDAAMSFLHSGEFTRKNLSDREYVKVLYRTFFNREADENGLTYWLDILGSKRGSRDSILHSFAKSNEFSKLMADYGIK